jgi:uncharacterized protein YycO
VQIVLADKKSLGGWFIRLGTWSGYSHAAVVVGTCVIGANMRKGVHIQTKEEFEKEYPIHDYYTVYNVDDVKASAFATAQIGKPYDWKNILGIVLERDWTETDSWICSELVAATLKAGGVSVLNKKINRVTPNDLSESVLVIPNGA